MLSLKERAFRNVILAMKKFKADKLWKMSRRLRSDD